MFAQNTVNLAVLQTFPHARNSLTAHFGILQNAVEHFNIVSHNKSPL